MKAIIISLIFLIQLSCSDDKLDVNECDCQIETTTIRVVTVNGVPVIKQNKSYRDYSINDCDLDGTVLSKNEIIVCE